MKMTDAPERIWVQPDLGMVGTGRWVTKGTENPFGNIEYIRADLAKPNVKPLEWEREDDGSLTAESVFGLYAAFYDGAYGWLVVRDGHDNAWVKYPSSDDGFDTEGEAMAACQAHYTAQIMKALGVGDE